MDTSRLKTVAVAIVIAVGASSAAAGPALDPISAGNVTVSLPRGWKTSSDAAHGTFVAQRDPGHNDSPTLLVTIQSSGASASANQLIDALIAGMGSGVKIIRRAPLSGGQMAIAEGMTGGFKVRLGAVAVAGNGAAIVGVLVSRAEQFDGLGGVQLVTSVLASIRANGDASAPAAPSPAEPAVSNTEPFSGNQTVDIEKGRLPLLAHAISVRELAGDWKDAGSAISAWYSAQTGQYVGFDAILSSATYHIAGNGSYTKDATHVSLGTHVSSVTSRDTGVIAAAGPSVIEISIDNKNGPTWHGWYVIRGWYQTGGQTVMKLNGPWQLQADGSLPPEAFNLDAWGKNTYYWVRAR